MERHIENYTLWILCVDDEVYEILTQLSLSNVRLLSLSKLATKELLETKPTRSIGEYCWTLTPFAPRFVFEADSQAQRVTYLDADLWFCKSPEQIFTEFDKSNKQVLITEHAYAPEYDQSLASGRFCVQFIIFNKKGGEIVRKWWENRCIEWCFARVENGKFGDQKYLDDWPNRFKKQVHVLSEKEVTLAPWNATRFPVGSAIFYHFHGLRILKNQTVDIGNYLLPTPTRSYIYRPYLEDISVSLKNIIDIGYSPKNQAIYPNFFTKLSRLLKSISFVYRNKFFSNIVRLP